MGMATLFHGALDEDDGVTVSSFVLNKDKNTSWNRKIVDFENIRHKLWTNIDFFKSLFERMFQFRR